QKQKKLIMLPSETMIWQPEFTDKTLSRKPGAVHSAGDVGAYTQAECNSRFITGIRLGGLSSVQTWNGPGWSDRSGYVVTGSVNGNRDELIDTTQARPIQYCINGTWYNAGSI
ncbi:hypothetical protein NEO56_07850, partial [Escherichia coli]|nr:hypothetical protein [Escherichia coli]